MLTIAGGNSTLGRTAMKLQPRPLYPKTISRSKCGNNSLSVLARYTYYCTGVWNEMGMVEMEWWNEFFFNQYKFCNSFVCYFNTSLLFHLHYVLFSMDLVNRLRTYMRMHITGGYEMET